MGNEGFDGHNLQMFNTTSNWKQNSVFAIYFRKNKGQKNIINTVTSL